MKEPELLAEYAAEVLESDTRFNLIADLRAAGKIKEGDENELLTWTWGPGRVGRVWLGEAPPRVGAIVETVDGHHWSRCILVVTETRKWGVLAELRMPPMEGELAIRLAWEDFNVVGHVRAEP